MVALGSLELFSNFVGKVARARFGVDGIVMRRGTTRKINSFLFLPICSESPCVNGWVRHFR